MQNSYDAVMLRSSGNCDIDIGLTKLLKTLDIGSTKLLQTNFMPKEPNFVSTV